MVVTKCMARVLTLKNHPVSIHIFCIIYNVIIYYLFVMKISNIMCDLLKLGISILYFMGQ